MQTEANVKPGAVPVAYTDPEPLYRFEDLAGRARAKALEWLKEGNTSDGALDFWRDLAVEDLEAMGFNLKRRPVRLMSGKDRQEPCFWYDLSYSQGSKTAFEGTCDLAKLATFKAQPHQSDLPALADGDRADLKALLEADPDVSLQIDTTPLGWARATLAFNPDADVEASALENRVLEALSDLVKRLCRHFMESGYAELEELGSDQQAADSAAANEYRFTLAGEVA